MFITVNGYRLVYALVLTLLGNMIFGLSYSAAQGDYRYKIPEDLNIQRSAVGLPPLRGSFINDMPIVNSECANGQKHSCLIVDRLMKGCNQYCNQTSSDVRENTDCFISLCANESKGSSIQQREPSSIQNSPPNERVYGPECGALVGLPVIPGVPCQGAAPRTPSTPSTSPRHHGETRQQCLDRVEKLIDSSIARTGSPGVGNVIQQQQCLNLPKE